MAAKTKKASKAPSGLKISRNGSKFEFSWKQPAAKYGEGQQLQYRVKHGDKWKSWTSITVGHGVTKKTVTIDPAKYFPTKSTKLSNIAFRVRGRQADTDKATFSWSDWTSKSFDIQVPNIPKLKASLSSSLTNVCTFEWDTEISSTSAKWFRGVLWQSILVKDSNQTNGAKLKWKSSALGWETGTGSDSGTKAFTEDTALLAAASYTRWVRVRARGPQGQSEWKYSKHVYARPHPAKVKSVSAKANTSNGYNVTVTWTAQATASHPIDKTTVEYKMAVPDADLACPSESTGWTDANVSKDTAGKDSATFQIDGQLQKDECLFVRVNTQHDRNIKYGTGTLAKIGHLEDPDGLSVEINQSTFRATVTATNNSDVPDSFIAVKYRRSKSAGKDYIIGIIPHGQTSTEIQCPDFTDDPNISFGVYAAVGTYTKKTRADGSDAYSLNVKMQSDHTVWDGGNVPLAPSITAAPTGKDGTVRLTWDWSWRQADSAILSWADHEDAWESTDEPSTYTVSNLAASAWNVSGLETGKTWYFRIRLTNGETEGPWSEMVSVDLSSAPFKPVLVLSNPTIQLENDFTAYWSYISTDATVQSYAEICEASETEGVLTYGDVLGHAETAQHVTMNCADIWESGQTYLLCLRLTSASGRVSEWSDPVAIAVAEPLTAEIAATSLQTIDVIVDDQTEETKSVLALRAMPLTLTVTGAGIGGTTTVIIERAADYQVDRPDESEYHGFEGETIVQYTQTGEALITINNEDLIGQLDDGAVYRIRAMVQDGLGQSDEVTEIFEVHWSVQAVVPEAAEALDGSIVKITPVLPTGAEGTEVCDIYRLSADRPVLILQDAAFGETYVDPYPAIGSEGGHRVVLRTVNGDYITEDNTFAWVDLEDGFEADHTIIDFGGEQVLLRYDMSLSNGWKKEFKETKYLGGSVQGDWNPGISRTLSVSATTVTVADDETIASMRRLSTYPGICHVRTPDGSSFDADIQVSEQRSYKSGGRKVDFSLSITRVDPEGMDAVPLSVWESGG